jgi:hypothetical protein
MTVPQRPHDYTPFSPLNPFTVPCRFCGAEAGTQCRNKITGLYLARFVAHLDRLTDATDAEKEADG